jgi:hypothetical protein
VRFSESPYIRWVKDKHSKPDSQYVHELDVLRAMVRQEHRQGDIGWGGTWTKERYQRLKDKHPEAVMAFEAELRWEREEKQHNREVLERYSHSPFIEEVKGWPESEAKDSYLNDLRQLRNVMIHSKKLGYGGFAMGMIYRKLRDEYPEAHEVFSKELAFQERYDRED